ncbi:hypothetical protein BGZ94_010064, partial [Podila epigama]
LVAIPCWNSAGWLGTGYLSVWIPPWLWNSFSELRTCSQNCETLSSSLSVPIVSLKSQTRPPWTLSGTTQSSLISSLSCTGPSSTSQRHGHGH